MGELVEVGGIPWRWTTNVVCAGPDERLVIVRGSGGSPEAAREALCRADQMEWRDAAFRKWRIRRTPKGITFISHYERLGPVEIPASEPLVALSSDRLESLLARARDGMESEDGTSTRLRT